jgi:Cu/Ag efflux pump CusA
MPAGISLAKATETAADLRKAVLEFPGVSSIVTQLGRNDDGTDPWTPSHIEAGVGLHPYDTWPAGETKRDLIQRMGERFHASDALPNERTRYAAVVEPPFAEVLAIIIDRTVRSMP